MLTDETKSRSVPIPVSPATKLRKQFEAQQPSCKTAQRFMRQMILAQRRVEMLVHKQAEANLAAKVALDIERINAASLHRHQRVRERVRGDMNIYPLPMTGESSDRACNEFGFDGQDTSSFPSLVLQCALAPEGVRLGAKCMSCDAVLIFPPKDEPLDGPALQFFSEHRHSDQDAPQ